MPITVRTSSGVIEYFTATTSTSHTVDLSDAAIGDVRVLVCNFSPDGTGTVPSHPSITGWEDIGVSTPTGAASDSRLSIYRRDVESGDTLTGATLGITLDNTATVGSVCFTLEGVDLNQIIDVTAPSFNTGTGSRDCPSITTVTDDAFVGHACVQDATSGAITDSDIPVGDTLLGTMNNNPPSNGMNLGVSYNIQATAGASGVATWQQSSSEEWVGATFAIKPLTEGIASVNPNEFRMHQANIQITISGAGFGATRGTGTVYISDVSTIADNPYLIDIGRAITSWADDEIIANLVFLIESEIIALQRLGPGTDRYTIVETDLGANEYPSLVTLHRAPAFTMVPSSQFSPGSTTAQLVAPATKTTVDFGGGRLEETDNPSATTTDLLADEYREDEWCFTPTIYTRKVTYEFRVVYDGQGPNAISQIPYLGVTSETGIKIRTVNFALGTTLGTQDITLTDLGPSSAIKGVLFFSCGATALDTVTADGRVSVGGAANDTTRFYNARSSADNTNPVVTQRASDINDEVLRIKSNAGVGLARATIDSWITDGVRLDITETDGNAYRCSALFFVDTGSDLQVTVVQAAANGITPVDITTIGFEPEFVLASTIAATAATTGSIEARLAVGFAHNDGGSNLKKQLSWITDCDNAVSPTVCTRWLDTDKVSGRHVNGANSGKIEINDFDANGFTQVGTSTAIATQIQFFFCVTTNGKVPIKVDSYEGPTSAAADWDITSPSFTPQAVLGIHTAVTGLDSPLKEAGEQSGCFYAFDTDGGISSIGWTEEDAVTTSNVAQWASASRALWVVADTQASDLLRVGTPTLNEVGFTFPAAEITTADATTRYGFFAVFGDVLEPIAGDINVSANTEELVLTAYPATVSLDRNIQASAEELVLTAYAATISLDVDVSANVEELTLTAYAATVSLDREVLASAEELVLTAYGATITVDRNVPASVEELVLTAYPAQVTQGLNIPTVVEELVLTAYPATISLDREIQANVEELVLTAYPASVTLNIDISASTEELVLTAYPATIGYDKNILALVEELVLTAYPASVSYGLNILTVTEELVLTPYPATVSLDRNIQAGVEELVLTTYPATITFTIDVTANVEELTLTTYPATVGLNLDIAAGVQELVLTTYPATIQYDRNVPALTEELVLTPYPASVSLGLGIFTSVEELILTAYPAQVGLDVNIQASVQELVLTPYPATISIETTIQTNVEELVLTPYPATVRLDREVIANAEELVLTPYQANVFKGVDIFVNTNVEELLLTTYPAFVSLDRNIEADVEELVITTYPATIRYDREVFANTEELVLTELSADVTLFIPPDVFEEITFSLEVASSPPVFSGNVKTTHTFQLEVYN